MKQAPVAPATHAAQLVELTGRSALQSTSTRQGDVIADAWDAVSRSAAHLLQTAKSSIPATGQPRKVKQINPAAFRQFQLRPEFKGIKPLPYCPRQYYNKHGERYVVSRAYAFGTFGRVHLGVRSEDKRLVALKEIPIEGAWHPSKRLKGPHPHRRPDMRGVYVTPSKLATPLKNIKDEIALATKADKAPLDAFIYERRAFIVSDMMAGDVFDAVVTLSAGEKPWERIDVALALLSSIANQMAHIHAQGVLHRDLKLENILRSPRGTFCVTDFGWATPLAANACMVSARAGTLGAIPLEVLRDEVTDHRFDVFSLGVAVTIAALNERPFTGTNLVEARNELEDFEDWLDDLRDAQGHIAEASVMHATGAWAHLGRRLILALGRDVAIFVLNHMLTGRLHKRASMATVVRFCASSRGVDPKRIKRAEKCCADIARSDTERAMLLFGIRLFDAAFPPDTTAAAHRSFATARN